MELFRYSWSLMNAGTNDTCRESNAADFLALTGNDTSTPRSAVLAINLLDMVTPMLSSTASASLHTSDYSQPQLVSRNASSLLNRSVIETPFNPTCIYTNTKIHLSCLLRHITIKWSVLLLVEKSIVGLHSMGNKKYTHKLCSSLN